MNHLRAALPVALILVLTACGGGGTTPTPPVEQPPAETPVPTPTPTPTPGQPDTPPDVPYYGEWGWVFEGRESYQEQEGRFSIIDLAPDSETESYGLYQLCYGSCFDYPDGYAYMGINDDGELAIELYRLSSTNDLVQTFEAVDADGELVEDDQGRLTFEGNSTAFEEFSDVTTGAFRATFIADSPALMFTD